jgi:hypothetical protein
MMRNVTMTETGFLESFRYLLDDWGSRFDEHENGPILKAVGFEIVKLPAHFPNLNAGARMFVAQCGRSICAG